ncbi:MAG: uroporphyrinogen-III synthase [Uliginosibacterium sp.]|nr:uroporphyrinogen-III synthase [Uliginosibacterium sp.]
MTAPLAGRCFVLTRPLGQADALAAQLRAQGATVRQFPVTEILPLADTTALQALGERLGAFSLAFFVSANAVRQTCAVLPAVRWPAGIRLATVGPASARALREAGFNEVLYPLQSQDTEGVLALAEFQAEAVAGRKVLILRGDGGRELLAESLRARGAVVEYQPCYQRQCARLNPDEVLASASAISGVIFSASEAIRHFCQILGDAAPRLLASVPVFAPHPRIAEEARRAGAQEVVLTNAGDAGIVAGILHHQWPDDGISQRAGPLG